MEFDLSRMIMGTDHSLCFPPTISYTKLMVAIKGSR